ncbi:hypothetical protein GGF42_002413 [Coemansia sp. RSA 2424]|nr:hypothetical protein GGF42_002413 [Coemansia sp. RSA 2424]
MTIMQPLAGAGFFADEYNVDNSLDYGFDDDIDMFIQNNLHPDCSTVCELAAPRTPALCATACKLVKTIAVDLEACLLSAAKNKKTRSNPRDNGHDVDDLSAWATNILDWTGYSAPVNTRRSINVKPRVSDADFVAPCYKSFLLFVAHRVKAHVNKKVAAGLLDPQDCRLILPVASEEAKGRRRSGFGDSDRVACGMFPLNSSVAEIQAAAAPHLVVADAEIVAVSDNHGDAELRLARETKALYFSQHNRRFAWGLTVSCRTIRAYVFGFDAVWSSSDMDMSSASGRKALISLLVDWSLCSVYCLGFDPSIRYALGSDAGRLHFEIDVHEKDKRTGKVASRTYYSNRCVGVAAASLTGRHARYFAASASPEMMDDPTVLIKDMWVPLRSDCSGDTEDESPVLNILHAAFDDNSEFKDKFPRLVSSGPVYLRHGDRLVSDTTAAAFAALPSASPQATAASGGDSQSSPGRLHKRTVMQWAGNAISAANNVSQVIVAIADAMEAHNAAYLNCGVIHGNITDRAILFRETKDRVSGALAEFNYATCDSDSRASAANREKPELMMFRSILSLKCAETPRTRLDDWESLLYLVICLGTYGINDNERRAFFAAFFAVKWAPRLPVMRWNSSDTEAVEDSKRYNMNCEDIFNARIRSGMTSEPLRRLATDMHRALFLHPGCRGTHAYRTEGGLRGDSLVFRNAFEGAIVAELLQVLAKYKQDALAELGKVKTFNAGMATPSAGPSLKRNWDKAPEHLPEKRFKAYRSVL